MRTLDLEVVWPLHRAHYLSPALADAGIDMETEPESSETTTAASVAAATLGRGLAVRALRAGGCSQRRVAELLDTSRRSVGRMGNADVMTARRDEDVLEQARTCLADTASRGSTAEERDAAEAWLREPIRDERQVAQVRTKGTARPRRIGHATAVKPKAATSPSNGTRPQPAVALEQINELQRQQRRIVHYTALIDYVRQGRQTVQRDGALAELLADITEAARTIGTILQTAEHGEPTTFR